VKFNQSWLAVVARLKQKSQVPQKRHCTAHGAYEFLLFPRVLLDEVKGSLAALRSRSRRTPPTPLSHDSVIYRAQVVRPHSNNL